MLGIVAHDLRNPLNTIRMQATLLRRTGAEPERIERAAIRINRLIDDLLDLTRMEAGRLTIEAVDLLQSRSFWIPWKHNKHSHHRAPSSFGST
ncbi:MAG TPA: histidine kinase dimerization/phospho-acceptor domain-containing protein [Steroidobacteraceae bacterium]